MLKIKPEELTKIAEYVKELTGIVLDQSKAYLIESRLGPIAEELGCTNYLELYDKARRDISRRIQNRIIDAITTNETFFFRDNSPFELLRYKVLPDTFDRLEESGRNDLKIWSAACSTGQEVYSIAIILRELLGSELSRWRIKLLGTDISDAAVAQASYGRYNRTEISRGLTPAQLQKYFHEDGNYWRIRDEIRAMAVFQRQNLLHPFIGMPKFDIILCRNVAIYFSPDNRKVLFNRIADQLVAGGILIIGASESLLGITDRFERKNYLRSVFYQLKA